VNALFSPSNIATNTAPVDKAIALTFARRGDSSNFNIMPHPLIDHFNRISPLTEEESLAIERSLTERECRKGEVLLQPGQSGSETYFVVKGCVREYYFVDGEERTSNFYTEGQWVLSPTGLLQAMPSAHYWVCAEDTTLVVGNEQKGQELFLRFPRFESISRKVMEQVIALQQERMASHIVDSPEQRYRKLLASRPDIVQRVPQYQIASYVGVKPESLSRIRKRMAEERR
jgi:CRP-like cAMP-binding protein